MYACPKFSALPIARLPSVCAGLRSLRSLGWGGWRGVRRPDANVFPLLWRALSGWNGCGSCGAGLACAGPAAVRCGCVDRGGLALLSARKVTGLAAVGGRG